VHLGVKAFTNSGRAAAVAFGLAAALTAGCDGGSDESIEVISPTDGTVVELPFEVAVESSAPLGSSEDGMHHLHLWYGDNETEYLVVESETVEIPTAPTGEQELHISLRNADHSETGAATSVRLVIQTPAG
jgi:hypothetical protein